MRATDRPIPAAQRGFGYLFLLLVLAVGSALLAAQAQDWTLRARREREEEFVFRAEQYRSAIQSYAAAINVNGCSNVQQFPAQLSDLLEDRRCGMVRHHLRRLYPDPVTRSQEWGLVADLGAIRGVYSRSELPLVRRVEGVKRYSDWRFVAMPAIAAQESSAPASAPPQ